MDYSHDAKGIGKSAPILTRRFDRAFYTGMSVALLLTVFAGFAPTYYLRSYYDHVEGLPRLLHFHGVVFSTWIVLLLVQTSLVAARNTRLHMRLGITGMFVAILLVLLGTWTAMKSAALGRSPPGAPPALVFFAIPFGEMITFPTFVAAGFYFRRNVEAHKRLMLLATIAITSAAVARLPLSILKYGPPAFFGVTDLFLLPMIAYDLFTRGRLHWATWGGGLFLIISQVLRVLVSGTDAWQSFAGWLTAFAK